MDGPAKVRAPVPPGTAAQGPLTAATRGPSTASGDRRRRPREQDFLRATLEATTDLVLGCDASGTIVLANAALRRFAGIAPEGPPPKAWAGPNSKGQAADQPTGMLGRLLSGESLAGVAVAVQSAAGLTWNMVASGQLLKSNTGRPLGAVVVWRDVTAERDLEARLAHLMLQDPLSHQPDWSHFSGTVRTALDRARRYHWSTAVLAVNVDHFTHISYRLGPAAGEQVLAGALRPYDSVAATVNTAARWGGDQFLLLCEDIADPAAAEVVALRVAAALREPLTIAEVTLSITAGMGIALTDDWATDPEVLISQAQTAMRVAKRGGAGRHRRFAPEMEVSLQDRMDGEDGLSRALAEGEFRVLYQPKLSLLTDGITGVEALLRWQNPLRGMISPLDFIPLAEETGLIVPIGRWVLEQVCRDAQKWSKVLPGGRPLAVAVDVSARQFELGLAETFGSIIGQSGIDPASICVEVTESMVMADAELAIATLRDLKALGLKISIDDFGTGFSSLAYLKRFPLDELKVDKSFVDGLGVDSQATAIVAAVMGMAHALDLRVVAEGVETKDQLSRLRTLGCDEAQGYLFARPSTVTTIDKLIAADKTLSRGRSGSSTLVGLRRPASGKVLVVDHAADVRMLARASLAAVGFEIQEVGSGEEALAAARKHRPNCILLDVNLPGISGLEVCRILREDARNEATTIVIVTGDTEPAEKVQAFSYRADDYMVKPFSPRDLVSRVTASMRRRAEMLATNSR